MIRMIQSKSAGHAKSYFSDALSKSNYYTNDQELAGFWQGKLADRLGISGATSKEAFFALCENRHPITGEHLTPLTKEDRTTGYDINFHCPKSVSVLHMLAEDDHILKAFQESVTETMQSIECDAKTRVRKKYVYDDRLTGELVWAHFTHQTARPVADHLPDPHLHSHCFVLNATWDETEQKFKAGQFRDIKRDMPFYQAEFHKIFSDKLMALGYRINPTAKSFEIDGVPKRVINLFCKRTDEIGRIAKEKGITDPKEKGDLGARTRAKKQKGISMEELKQEWRAQIEALGPGGEGEGDTTVRHAPLKAHGFLTAQQCIDYALLHCFERFSVVPDRKLIETACRYSLGNSVSLTEINDAFKKDGRIIHINEGSRTVCTTREVLAEEERMVNLARKGQGKMLPLYETAPETGLSGQQAAAVAHVLTTYNRVSIIRGAAGTGKTTLMRTAVEFIEKAGKQVTVVAPTADASRGVLRTEGFDNAETVAKLLVDQEMQDKLKGQVLWVDEAGLLGTKDLLALLEIATRNDAQLILGGDTRQHASVVRGDALRILNTVGGIKTAEVSKIYRQQNEEYRAAVEDLSKGDVASAFAKLDQMKSIISIDPMQPNKQLVDDFIETIKRGKTALVIAPTHAQGEAVTQDIRERLKSENLLGKKDVEVTRLSNIGFTEAEKKDPRNFEAGQFIQFNQNAPGITRGSLWQVDSKTDNTVHIKNDKGEIKTLPTATSNRYDVYLEKELLLTKGDRVRITHPGYDENKKRLENGQVLKVISVTKSGDITLKADKGKTTYKLNRNYRHISHAHCITSYGSQGKTVDEVFISQPAGTFMATNAKQFYVSFSRAKERARVYTDDKKELLHHASDMGDRQSAMEVVSKHKKHKDIILHLQRQELNQQKPKEINPITKSKETKAYEPDI